MTEQTKAFNKARAAFIKTEDDITYLDHIPKAGQLQSLFDNVITHFNAASTEDKKASLTEMKHILKVAKYRHLSR